MSKMIPKISSSTDIHSPKSLLQLLMLSVCLPRSRETDVCAKGKQDLITNSIIATFTNSEISRQYTHITTRCLGWKRKFHL